MSLTVDFADLFTQNHDQIYAYLFRRTSDPHLAEDLTAEVFVKAIAAIQRGRAAHSHIKGWLYRIAHNLLIDFYRERGRRTHVSLDEIAGIPDARQPDTEYEQRWLRACIEDAAASITADQRQVVMLRLEGCSYAEIAEEVGTTVGGIKARQNLAFAVMSSRLANAMECEPRKVSATLLAARQAVVAVLREQGPLTTTELIAATGFPYPVIWQLLEIHAELFIKVRQRGNAFVWGLV